ncbi:hypothetical protein RQN9TF_12560 [Rhodococcus qingshengii]|uniref:hypothetical protein n=1 Tax=Rhodococcus TaxID=1827 RepID=UPI000F61A93C|nr:MULTISPECIES: hypothetical protein [Rhodococcus]AZI61825.1 hypothetical protein EHW12_12100 [Rhodococcus sp. NJ-530]BDQ20036.1 hypothetical protein RQN9TF_12560 [Rhodococcus qingshengii]
MARKFTDHDRGYKLFIRKRKGGIAVTYSYAVDKPAPVGSQEYLPGLEGLGVTLNPEYRGAFSWRPDWEVWLSPQKLGEIPSHNSYDEQQFFLNHFESVLRPYSTERLAHSYLVVDVLSKKIHTLLAKNPQILQPQA